MTVHVPKVGLVQLGCPKNLVDSERILTQLRAEGYVIAPGYADADNGRAPPLEWWTPPPEWGMGTHTHHLKNLYIYFWRWAALKVFGSGWHAATGEPEIARQGIVCFITVAEYLKCQIGFPKRQMGRDRNGHS